jgi:hypothetical protein
MGVVYNNVMMENLVKAVAVKVGYRVPIRWKRWK